MRRLMVIVLLLVLTALPGSIEHPAEAAPAQMRALWVDAFHDGFRTPEQVRALVADARRGNINTLFVQMRRRGDVFYRSNIEPFAETGDEGTAVPTGFDPLAALLSEAHANGIEVHAWMVMYPAWHTNARYQTSDPKHVWNRHGPRASGSDMWVMLKRNADGSLSQTYQLDPGHPGVQRYFVDVMREMVQNYAVDGIHFDYIRYGEEGPEGGYNPTAVNRFNVLHGRSGTPDPYDLAWKQWRRDQVTALVRRLYVETTAIRPQLKVSAATIAWGAAPTTEDGWRASSAYSWVMQDWRGWLEEGILDIAVPMTYHREYVPGEKSAFDSWISWNRTHQYGRHVVTGQGVYLNYIEESLAQGRRALSADSAGRSLAGLSFFSYASANVYGNEDYQWNTEARNNLPRQPWSFRPELNDTFLTALSQRTSYTYASGGQTLTASTEPIFPEAASTPPMPWKRDTGNLHAQLVVPAGQPTYNADWRSVELRGPVNRTLRSDGEGWLGATALPPGSYSLTFTDISGRQYEIWTTLHAGQTTQLRIPLQASGGQRVKLPEAVPHP